MSHLLDVADAVTIQYQERGDSVKGIQSVSLQVSLPLYQNITDETVIKVELSGSNEDQGEDQPPSRPAPRGNGGGGRNGN